MPTVIEKLKIPKEDMAHVCTFHPSKAACPNRRQGSHGSFSSMYLPLSKEVAILIFPNCIWGQLKVEKLQDILLENK